jgi:hypothetical protein
MFLGMWDQVRLMCSYCRKNDIAEVPDPYYGGPAGFDKVNKKRVPYITFSKIVGDAVSGSGYL